MKVLLINGSPHGVGCTYTALEEVARALHEDGVETELIQIGNGAVHGCIGCGHCKSAGCCVFTDDQVNEAAAKLRDADGLVVGRRHARACGGRGCLSGQCGFRSGTGTVAEGAGASGPAGPGGRAADSRTRRGFCAPGKSAAAAAAPRTHPGVILGALSAYAVAR